MKKNQSKFVDSSLIAGSSEEAEASLRLVIRTLDVLEDVLEAVYAEKGTPLDDTKLKEVFGVLRGAPGLLPALLKGDRQPGVTYTWLRNPFGRALVVPFEDHLVSVRLDKPFKPDDLSRHFLPAYFVALRLVVGSEQWECAEALVREIVADGDMSNLFEYPEVRREVFVTYGRLVRKLEEPAKHIPWFCQLINARVSTGAAKDWAFTAEHFKKILVNSLCDSELGSEPREEFITHVTEVCGPEYCAEVCASLERLLNYKAK